MSSPREIELERELAEAREKNRVLHRRIQQAEATRPALRSLGRAKLAQDCVRLETTCVELRERLAKIRAIAAGWGRQTFPPEQLMQSALRDIADTATLVDETASTPH